MHIATHWHERISTLTARIAESAKFFVLRLLLVADAGVRTFAVKRNGEVRVVPGKVVPESYAALCVFAHYDRDGIVDDYVLTYLAEIRELGCEIVFVSTAPGLTSESILRVSRYVIRIIGRPNRGYDFASWRDGLASVGDLSRFDRLILANDSVYGPLRKLSKVFKQMTDQAPAWGITDSVRYTRHLQSYFLVFERSVLESPVFREFWRRLPDYHFKHSVIAACEVGLSRSLADAGYALAALCDYRSLDAEMRKQAKLRGALMPSTPVNATHWGWRTLIKDFGCPFIKIQLLRDNPKGVADIGDWEDVLREVSSYDTGLIRRHLDRVRR